MPVLLRHSGDLASVATFDRWVSIGVVDLPLAPKMRVANLAASLETSFDAISDHWFELASELGKSPSSNLAHAPSCAANVSDLGVMMAWDKLVADMTGAPEKILVVCDDPWLYRQLTEQVGIDAGEPPSLLQQTFRLAVRGHVARLACAARLIVNNLRVRAQKSSASVDKTVVLSYGHPRSKADGYDGYFANLLQEYPKLRRILHVDCPASRALELVGDNQTLSLHAWGRIVDFFELPFARWKPNKSHLSGKWGWLVKRAAALESGTGQAAMVRWQQICQRRWLQQTRPACVIWPWENHGWERHFVRTARALGIPTIGYQHSVVGQQMLNYSLRSNADGLESIPDQILCTGGPTFEQLGAWGLPRDRLKIAGALRIPEIKKATVDPSGPVYMALSFDQDTAKQMLDAADRLTEKGYRFVVKNHPMQPTISSQNDQIEITPKPFSDHKGLRALVFAASTVGLEAAIAGLPTIRFQTEDKVALNILPPTVPLLASDAAGLEEALGKVTPLELDHQKIFSPVNRAVWKKALTCDRANL